MGEPLLPTPKQAGNRNSRKALTDQHFSDLGLEQALEVAEGKLPRELNEWAELPPQHRRSSPCSPVSGDSTSPSNPSDGSASDRSSGSRTASSSSKPTGPASRDGGTSGGFTDPSPTGTGRDANGNSPSQPEMFPPSPSAPTASGREPTCSPADGPASRSRTRGNGSRRKTSGTAGPTSVASLQSFDRGLWWARTSGRQSLVQRLDGTLVEFSGTWPAWGMTRDGEAFELPTSVLPTDGNGSSSLPTPTARLGDQRGAQAKRYTNPARSNDLDDFVLTLPTPTSNDVKNAGYMTSGGRRYPTLPGAVGATGHHDSLLPTPRTPSGGPDSTGTGKRPSGAKGTTNLAGELLRLGDHTNPPSEDGKP